MEAVVLKADGTPVEDKCPHKTTQTFQCAGPSPERTVCIDCGKEL